jgi:hypothetical protein
MEETRRNAKRSYFPRACSGQHIRKRIAKQIIRRASAGKTRPGELTGPVKTRAERFAAAPK